jgi:hypothetical protein
MLTIKMHRTGCRQEVEMVALHRRFDAVCFGLYVAAALAGISLEAITQIFQH